MPRRPVAHRGREAPGPSRPEATGQGRPLELVGARDRRLPAVLDVPPDGIDPRGGIVLAHGAGGTSRMPFLARAARRLAQAGWIVLRFDFGYATGRGRPGPPDRRDAPERTDFAAALEALRGLAPEGLPLYAAGKSYGGRVATFLVAEERPDVAGVIVFGYPIEPPGRARPHDVAALRSLGHPLLVVQGSRDTLGPLAVLREVLGVVEAANLVTLEGADHSFRPPAGTHVRPTLLEDHAIDAAIAWLAAQ